MASRFWVGGTGTWDNSATTHWSATSGGSSGASAPTSADDVTFDSNSGLSSGQVVTVGSGSNVKCKTLTVNAGAGTTPFLPVNYIEVSGNVTINTGYTASNDLALYIIIKANCTFTSNGKRFGGAILIDAFTFTLGDAFDGNSGSSLCTLTSNANSAVINLASKNFTGSISITHSTCTLTLGTTNTINMVYNYQIQSDTTLNNGTTTINMKEATVYGAGVGYTFSGGGKTYGTVNCDATAGGYVYINDANTFATLALGAGCVYNFQNSNTQTITTSFTCTGTGNTTIQSDSGGTQWTLSKSSGSVTISGVTLKDSVASGGATFTANNSTDGGNNSGWNIVRPPGGMFMFF